MSNLPTSLADVIDQIQAILEDPEDSLLPDDDLFTAGLDSIRLMQLTDRWAADGVSVDPMALLDDPTPNGFWKALSESMP